MHEADSQIFTKPTMPSLGAIIRARRIALGLTPREFADEIGRSELIVARIEHEDLQPDALTLQKCAQVLQTHLDELVRKPKVARDGKSDTPR